MDARQWDERYRRTGDELVWSAEPNRFVVAHTRELAPGRALDVAAGEGRNAVWLAEQGWTVLATDFSAVAIEKGERLAQARGVADRVAWRQADAAEAELDPASLDLAVIAYLHLPRSELAAALDHVLAALAPGATLLVVGHDRDNLEHGTGGPQDAALLYTPALITELVAVRATATTAETVTRPTDDGPALDTVWVGRAD